MSGEGVQARKLVLVGELLMNELVLWRLQEDKKFQHLVRVNKRVLIESKVNQEYFFKKCTRLT